MRLLILGILLVLSSVSRADSITATPVQPVYMYQPATGGQRSATADIVCTAMTAAVGSGTHYLNGPDGSGNYSCYRYNPWQNIGWIVRVTSCPDGTDPVNGHCYTCPDSTWTLTGSTCTHPDPCGVNEQTTFPGNAGWSICSGYGLECSTGGGGQPYQMPESICDGSCVVSVTDVQTGSCSAPPGSSPDNPQPISCVFMGMKTGASCSQSTIPEAGTPPTIVKKVPPCDAADGVMTSSSGSVKCVPSGTPTARKPLVTKSTVTKVNADGSVTTIETTTTRDPLTGAESSSTTSKTTAPDGSVTQPEGPTTTDKPAPTGDTPGKENDFCAKNPGLQICKGGLNEEQTQKAIQEDIKTIKESLDPDQEIDQSAIDDKIAEYEAEAGKIKAKFEDIGAKGQSDDGFWTWAFLPEIPATQCQPMGGTVMGHELKIDLCDKFAMIRDLAGWALYITTIFGLFRIFTGKQQES